MSRPRGQWVKGRARSQPVDPITGRRLNLRGATIAELESRTRRVRDVKDSLKFGDITIREAHGRLRPALGLNLRLAELWARYLRGLPGASERIASSMWKNQLAPWFGEATVWELTETKMRGWKADLERQRRSGGARGYAPKTIRATFDFLRACLALAIRDGSLSEYPWGPFTVPNPHRPQNERESLRDPAELVALLTAAREWDISHGKSLEGRFPAIMFLALTGLRQGEAAGASWSDVDLDRDPEVLRVRRQAGRGWPRHDGGARPSKSPKNGPREQILHPNVSAALRLWRTELQRAGRYRPDGPLFPRPGGGLWRTAGRVVSPAAVRDCVRLAGLPNLSAWVAHSLRHSFSRLELVGHGGDLRSVAARTGHHDLSVLEGYLRKPARLAGGSKIPELPPALSAARVLDVAPLERLPRLDPGEFAAADADPALPPAYVARLELPDENREIEQVADSWPALAVLWLERGRKLKRPKPVTLGIKAAYHRAYARAVAQGQAKPDARAAGNRARRAALGAWGKTLASAERAHAQAAEPGALARVNASPAPRNRK